MAILDTRLLDLIETLVVARLDWLAFELIEGIQAGRPAEEPEEALAAARQSIRSNMQPKARGEPHATLKEPQSIPADEQIEWAAVYVEERLDEALAQLQASIDALDFIVAGTTEHPETCEALAQDIGAAGESTVSVLLNVDGEHKSGREDVADARDSFPVLRAALAEWTSQARGQIRT